jgi:hypothetical protein
MCAVRGDMGLATCFIDFVSQRSDSFASLKVRLLTKDGLFKSETECSPKGYHFTPVYDPVRVCTMPRSVRYVMLACAVQGEYKMVVIGPDGWSFQPQEHQVWHCCSCSSRLCTCTHSVFVC